MELYLDLSKGYLNTGKLVKKQVQVHGKNGKVFSRMQWVDPNTGQPVHEHGHEGQDDPHARRIRGLTAEQRSHIASAYIHTDKDRAKKFAEHTDIPDYRKTAQMGLQNHVYEHLDKVPHAHIKSHLDHYAPEKQQSSTPSKLGLEHTDHGLSEEELSHRTGKYGPLDVSKLTDGDRMIDHNYVKNWLRDSQIRVNAHKLSKGMGINVEEHFTNAFGSLTWEGLNHTFSIPELNIHAQLDYIDVHMEKDGKIWNSLSFLLRDDNDHVVADMTRLVRRDEEGKLHINNHTLEVRSKSQGMGISNHIYARSEQLWRHMSGGHPLEIRVCANISCGTYAWAKKGFDFMIPETSGSWARDDLADFCEENEVNLKNLLDKNGYKSINDIKHPWEFAVLDDGYEWEMNDLKGANVEQFGGEWKGSGDFGKAFCLAGMNYWDGIRRLNSDSDEEKIYDPLEKYRGKTNGA